MDYNSLVGDQQQIQQVPLMQNMPSAGPMPSAGVFHNFGYDPAVVPPPNFAIDAMMPNNTQEACDRVRTYEDYYRSQGVDMNTFYMNATSKLRGDGFFTGNQTYQNTCQKSPFESEVVQYLLLFLLAYVVIKKL